MLKLCKPTAQSVRVIKLQMRRYQGKAKANQDGFHVVDLRSDTVTKPTAAMRQAMATAEVGDDVMGEDPTVNALQNRCAGLFGTEAALFVPSGTMGNLISALVHCQGRFQEVIVGDKSHMFLYETGTLGQFAGVQCSVVPNQPNGTILLDDIRSRIRPLDDDHQPWTKLICLENTHNKCGGKILSLDYMAEVKQVAVENNLKVHLDGARVLNAAAAQNIPVSEIVKHVDSVSVCFSKGMACPVGSVIAGTKDFIQMARRTRKALGGGTRQAGILAAAMMVSLDTILPRLSEDHTRARSMAEGIMASPVNDIVSIDVAGVETNIIMMNLIKGGQLTVEDVCERMTVVSEQERDELGDCIAVLMGPFSRTSIRMVLHNDIGDDDVDKTIKKYQYVLRELSQN